MNHEVSSSIRSDGLALPVLTLVPERRRILLIDPDLELLRIRQYLLAGCSYLVQAACDYRDLFQFIAIGEPHVAVINHSLGEVELRVVTQYIRQRWPRVRILIVDQKFPGLEDHLYDDAVDARFSPGEFLAVLDRCYQSSQVASQMAFQAARSAAPMQ